MGHRIQRRRGDHARGKEKGACELACDQQQSRAERDRQSGSGVVVGPEDHETRDVGQNTHVGDESGDEKRECEQPSERIGEIKAVVGEDFLGHLRAGPGEIEDGLEHQHHARGRTYQQGHARAVPERCHHQSVERLHAHTGLFSRKSRKSPRHSLPRPPGESRRARRVSA